MTYTWLAVDALTGRVICDLPDLTVEKIGVTLCNYWSGRADLPVVGAPQDWQLATSPWATYLVLLDDETPIWGGWVNRRDRGAGSAIQLAITTWESYLNRRYVQDLTYTGLEQCALIADLIANCVATNTAPFVPPALIVETSPGATARDRTYTRTSSKRMLAVLQELSGVEGGPEWTITWRHLSNPERYLPVLSVADRIGVAPPVGLGPAAMFEMPGPVIDFSLVEDWSGEAAANHVTATSSASSDVVPQSDPQVFADPIRPTLEYRWTPSTSITRVETLNAHAIAALSVMRDGAVSLTMTAAREDAPRLGAEWGLGDDVGYLIEHPSVGVLSGSARAVAWEATVQGVETVTPILASGEEF